MIGDKYTTESQTPKFPVTFLQSSIMTAEEVKNLGVTFDSENTFDNHIDQVCRACYYHLIHLRSIHKFLTVGTAVLVAYGMVSSQLDYYNFLIYGVSKSSVVKLH